MTLESRFVSVWFKGLLLGRRFAGSLFSREARLRTPLVASLNPRAMTLQTPVLPSAGFSMLVLESCRNFKIPRPVLVRDMSGPPPAVIETPRIRLESLGGLKRLSPL